MTLVLSLLAMAFGGACVAAWGVALRRDGAVPPRSGLRTGEAASDGSLLTTVKEATVAPALTRYHDTTPADAPHLWPGPVMPSEDAAMLFAAMDAPPSPTSRALEAARMYRERVIAADGLCGLARHEAADWTGWRPSYDGEDHDPGEPYRPAD